MILIIVESPAKCKKIESFLKGQKETYRVVASKGHIRDLDKGLKAIDVEKDFKPSYKIIPSKRSVVSYLKSIAKTANEIIIASDLDREGEAIGYHVAYMLELDIAKTKRIVFNQITKKAILKALANPKTIDINLFNSQQARRILDRLMGFEISPVLWKHIKIGLSAGRCQSVALKLVCERDAEIDAFERTSFYQIKCDFIFDKNGEMNIDGVFLNKFPDKKSVKAILKKCTFL